MSTKDSLEKILDQARRREKYAAKTVFPNGIIKHGERTIAWFERYDKPWNVHRFKHMFIHLGQAKLGNEVFVQKVVPIIWTDDEFVNLLRQMGYEVEDTDETEPWTVLISGDQGWADTKFINRAFRDFVGTVVTGGMQGAETLAAIAASGLDLDVIEEQARTSADITDLFDSNGIEGVVIFHTNPKSSKRAMFLVKEARKRDIPVKVVSGRKMFSIIDWLEENYD